MTYSPHYFISSIIKKSERHESLLDEHRTFHNASSSTASSSNPVIPMISSKGSDNRKRHLGLKIRGLFLPHRPYKGDYQLEHQQSIKRCESPDENVFDVQLPVLYTSMPQQSDLNRLFRWVVQNIEPTYHKRKERNKKQVKEQKLPSMNALEQETLDMISDMVLNVGVKETAKQVLDNRSCFSSEGMVRLFVAMAHAAGIQDIHIIHGYLKAPKDTILEDEYAVPINHTWCIVKIEREYRVIDCWLASPFHPQNNNEIDMHWFLTHPNNTRMTHLTPQESSLAFFNMPYVRHAYFRHPFRLLQCQTEICLEDEIFYLSFKTKERDIRYYAETESEQGVITRGLTQCKANTYTVKGTLPSNETSGWLKLYVVDHDVYHLSICFHLKQHQQTLPFAFVQLNIHYQHEFYIQEPQCYLLYPYQTYSFCIYNKVQYHKLAIQSPSGKLVKLMSNPQDQMYDARVTITEIGLWSLLCIVNQEKIVLANWCCPHST